MARQDLIPQNLRTKDEQKEIARRGGIASGKARLAKKHGRELVQALLSLKEADPKVVAEVASSFGIDPKQVTKDIAMNARQIDKAIRKADTAAYSAVNKVSGALDEAPTEVKIGGNLEIKLTSEKAVSGLRKAIDNGAQPAPPAGE